MTTAQKRHNNIADGEPGDVEFTKTNESLSRTFTKGIEIDFRYDRSCKFASSHSNVSPARDDHSEITRQRTPSRPHSGGAGQPAVSPAIEVSASVSRVDFIFSLLFSPFSRYFQAGEKGEDKVPS